MSRIHFNTNSKVINLSTPFSIAASSEDIIGNAMRCMYVSRVCVDRDEWKFLYYKGGVGCPPDIYRFKTHTISQQAGSIRYNIALPT